ncbi:hypothetical protein P3X46_013057 [Hevea brasiliensis]|uniref:Fe2OG dioxygenase domain-containing protein n=1 Tax=Hevea brasiliensis TaxID=3981 RepID=A0ABQ9M689_HEVBR|nr:protein SRG1 [Hevea brasiliensis]KAJ9174411.1 hypothetical protein P3X46_013057 [Hevea brasiliensis]
MGEVQVPENLEWSLPVPSVQELALQHLHAVPPRYIRDHDADAHEIITDQSLSVPLIDLAKLLNQDSQAMELQKLHSACKHWGLFQLINHGVSDESVRNMRDQAQEFFELPLQEKERWVQKPGNLEGYGHSFITSEQQKLEWSDMIFLKVLPAQNKNLEFWPQKPLKFRETLESYTEDVKGVVVSLVRLMAMGLQLQDKEFYKTYQQGRYDVRMNFYPPCPEPERVVGVNAHADINGITLLLECGDTPGLQVLKDGKWILVQPIDGAIVVDIGQIMEIMSNGIYKSPLHRAVVNKSKERLSIVTFCYPNSSHDIGPAKELINSGIPPLYKTVSLDEYLHLFLNSKLEVPFIESLKF